ncbi:MAG: alpha/beta hydrolase [Planctomycetes bacterium]|nr:alpha/beta hydrolase [Planctomycetota bacterium]
MSSDSLDASIQTSASRIGSRSPATWRRTLGRWLLLGLAVYLLIMGVLYFLQTRLIFPGSRFQGTREVQMAKPPLGAELVTLKSPADETIRALFAKALDGGGMVRADAARRPTILYFYGNGMALVDTLDEVDAFRRRGANVMVVDYLGFGMSGGRPSEQNCYATADAAYEWLANNPDVDRGRIIIAGWSLGSGVAADLASRKPAAGLMLFSAFTSVTDVASYHYPWLPVRWLLSYRFESVKKLPQVTCPILLAHGDQDTVVPYAMMGQLGAVCRPVTAITVPGVGHHDFWGHVEPAVLPAVARLIDQVAAP